MDTRTLMLLANMMSNNGGSKILNLTAVNAVYDKDYIFTNDGTTNVYFYTDKFSIPAETPFKIKIKFLKTSNTDNGIFCTSDTNSYHGSNSYYRTEIDQFRVSSTLVYNYNDIPLDTWIDIIIERKQENLNSIYFTLKSDSEIYKDSFMTGVKDYDFSAVYNFGKASNYYLNGKIDFKETDIIINGQSVLWI